MDRQMLPVVFVSHGAPLVALEHGPYQDALAAFGRGLRPAGVVVVSAHWEEDLPIRIMFTRKHTTIHDFGGFPAELYAMRYDAPGSPEIAAAVERMLNGQGWETQRDDGRGLDHGTWIPLRLMYPAMDVPTVQISLPSRLSPEELYALGDVLRELRSRDVLLMGSGGIVHNLSLVNFDGREGVVDPWAKRFDDWVWERIQAGDHDAIKAYRSHGDAALAVPVRSGEHFVTVFPVLGAAGKGAVASPICDGFTYANLSMRCFALR